MRWLKLVPLGNYSYSFHVYFLSLDFFPVEINSLVGLLQLSTCA